MLRKSLCVLFLLIFSQVPAVFAGDPFEPFSEERLQVLQAEGRPILVEVYADWCSTCRRQAPILSELLGSEAFAELAALKLDWDDQRAAALKLGAPRQSTLILYHGERRVDLSVAETDPDRLRAFLAQINQS